MYPHERSLVQRMAGKPFALLGINSDPDREAIKQVIQEKELAWRSWHDGSIDGPIHRQWQVEERPGVYLIDAAGVIRYKNVLGDELDRAVDTLVDKLAASSSD